MPLRSALRRGRRRCARRSRATMYSRSPRVEPILVLNTFWWSLLPRNLRWTRNTKGVQHFADICACGGCGASSDASRRVARGNGRGGSRATRWDVRTRASAAAAVDVESSSSREFKMASSVSLFVAAALACSVVAFPAEPEIVFSTSPRPTAEIDPNHVPSSACVDMLPQHGPNGPIRGDPPYVVTVSTTTVAKGETVQVVVKGLANQTFKGLYIQGRINDKPVGRWLAPANQPQVAISDCPPGNDNALSYVSRRDALKSLALEWVAPSDVSGSLVFQATIVKTYAEFWANVRSPALNVGKAKV